MLLSILKKSEKKLTLASSACLSLLFASQIHADSIQQGNNAQGQNKTINMQSDMTYSDNCRTCTFWFKPDRLEDYSGFSTSASFLLFKPYVSDLWYANYEYGALPGDPPNVPTRDLNVLLRGHLHHATYGWDPGVRVSFGYNIGKNTPKINLEYTYFSGGGEQTVREKPNDTLALQPFFFVTGPNADWAQIQSHLDFKLNQVDLTSYLPCYTSKRTRIEFLFGAKGLWVKQDWDLTLTPTNSTININQGTTAPHSMDNDWSYSAGGVQLGLACEIDMVQGLNFHFIGSGISTVGQYHIRNFSRALPNGFISADTKTSEIRFIPGYRFLTGLSWKHCFPSCSFGLGFDWEINGLVDLHEHFTFFLQGNTPQGTGTWEKSSVIIQGFLVSAGIDF